LCAKQNPPTIAAATAPLHEQEEVILNCLRIIVGLILAGLSTGIVFAQETVGELLAAGGKQLSKDEVLATLRGATASGPTATGGETEVEWKENGTVSGTITTPALRRGSGSVFGTWRVDDSGRVCRDVTIRIYESAQFKDCFPVFRLADQIYFPASDASNPSARLLKRTIKR
jgi:hypothetical protein